jgi:hypothetical protein
MSGDDGAFRFDRLAPGEYTVVAASGWRGMRRMMRGGGDNTGDKVTVESAKTTRLDVKVAPPPEDDAPF